jgi:hypothetical protein
MRLHVGAERFGRLLSWDLPLPVDGTTIVAQAPEIDVRLARPSAPTGELVVPIDVGDDGTITAIAVFLNSDKLLYHPGGTGHVALMARLPLVEGNNRLVVRATDDQGLVRQRTIDVLGLARESDEGITGATE